MALAMTAATDVVSSTHQEPTHAPINEGIVLTVVRVVFLSRGLRDRRRAGAAGSAEVHRDGQLFRRRSDDPGRCAGPILWKVYPELRAPGRGRPGPEPHGRIVHRRDDGERCDDSPGDEPTSD